MAKLYDDTDVNIKIEIYWESNDRCHKYYYCYENTQAMEQNTVDEDEIDINLFDDGKEGYWDLKCLGFEDV